jgi:hypothetical protein
MYAMAMGGRSELRSSEPQNFSNSGGGGGGGGGSSSGGGSGCVVMLFALGLFLWYVSGA